MVVVIVKKKNFLRACRYHAFLFGFSPSFVLMFFLL